MTNVSSFFFCSKVWKEKKLFVNIFYWNSLFYLMKYHLYFHFFLYSGEGKNIKKFRRKILSPKLYKTKNKYTERINLSASL